MDRSPRHPAGSVSRRQALRLLGGAALAAVPILGGAAPAGAGRMWCSVDPVVKIDGQVADVLLSSYLELNLTATGPAQLVISVPVGVSTELLAVDLGFGGWGYAVTFVEDGSLKWGRGGPRARVEAFVPSSDGSLPLRVDFKPRSSDLGEARATGSVNEWVVLTTR